MSIFDLLPENDKVRMILKEGIFLESVTCSSYSANLYALDNEFVEVVVFPSLDDTIQIKVLQTQHLDIYLDRMAMSQF